MSRVIVKNLPKDITEDRLSKHFSSQGTITDIKLMKTKEGVFRKFAFIGFHSDEESHKAMSYFNKTFIDSSKIVVEIALPFGDGNLERPWSKYSSGSSANKTSTEDSATGKKRKKSVGESDDESEDEEFKEFLDAHKKDRTIWGNDETIASSGSMKTVEKAVSDSSSDEEYNQEITSGPLQKIKKITSPSKLASLTEVPEIPSCRYTAVLKGIPFTATEADVKKFFHPLSYRTVRMTLDKKGRPSGKCFVDFKSESDLRKSLKFDKKYMGSRYVEVFRDTGTKAEKEGVPQNKRKNFSFNANLPDESKNAAESGRLFVRNLSYDCTEEQLKAHFEKIGPVSSIELPRTKNNKTKGIAYVTFLFPEHAIKTTNDLTFKPFQGRLIHIIPSNKVEEDGEEDGTDFKKKKLKKQKQALQDEKCWNILFLNQNAVSDYLAHRMKISKSDMLDPTSDNSAIQLALGETQLLQEIKEFLSNEGVNLDSFTSSKRSKRIIICKNIPFGTQEREINELFAEHGALGRLVLPPTGTIALIEYIDPSDAMKAYKKLSYSKFKHLPLYLEWAPEETFSSEFKPSDKKIYTTIEEDVDNMEHATLFAKNLNFDTTEAQLKEFFEKCGKVINVSIAKKPCPKSTSGFLSRGYGFVEYGTKEAAKDAMKKLNGKLLQDYAIELKLSEKQISKVPETVKKSRNLKETSAKLLVKNVPFETNKKDLKKLFSAFGEIKHVRLPKKLAGTGDHRGFAFVEYSSIAEARKAFEATGDSTHIYGRRLVVEWAKEDATVAEIREKTAEVFVPTELKKKKKKKGVEELIS